jgi:hypothetical protein
MRGRVPQCQRLSDVGRGWAGETARLGVEARFELSHRNGASLPQSTVPYQNQEGLTAEG